MTQEEKDLALRIFEKAMEDKDNLSSNYLYSILSVQASKSIYCAIDVQDKADILEEEKKYEEERDAENERREQRRAELKESRKNANYYLVYKSWKYNNGSPKYEAFIKSSTQEISKMLPGIFSSFYYDYYIGVSMYKISKDDADNLLAKHKPAKSHSISKYLECNSAEDFLKYVRECSSAEQVDLTGCKTIANVTKL